jgi:hypothetical protein
MSPLIVKGSHSLSNLIHQLTSSTTHLGFHRVLMFLPSALLETVTRYQTQLLISAITILHSHH